MMTDFFQTLQGRSPPAIPKRLLGLLFPARHGQIRPDEIGVDALVFGQNHQPFDEVLHLPDIARPIVAAQDGQGLGGKGQFAGVFLGNLVEKMDQQARDVLLALAKRRRLQGEDVQAVIEVRPKRTLLGQGGQILVGGGQDAHVHLPGLVAAEALEFPVLEHAQQLGLEPQRQLTDLVQKDGALAGLFETAGLGLVGAGEGTLLIAEQLRFQEIFRNGGAVDLDEGVVLAVGQVVDDAADQCLARAGFTQQQHRGLGRRDLFDLALHLLHGQTLADDIKPPRLLGQPVLERNVLALESRDLGLELLVEAHELADERGHHGQKGHVLPGRHLVVEESVHIQDADGLAVQNNRHADKEIRSRTILREPVLSRKSGSLRISGTT